LPQTQIYEGKIIKILIILDEFPKYFQNL